MVQGIEDPKYPALQGKDEHFYNAHLKDAMTWKILATQGGLVLDLDTICVKDVSDLIGEREMLIPMDVLNIGDTEYPYNSAIVMAGDKGSTFAMRTANECLDVLQKENIVWGETGPILISRMAKAHPAAVATPEFRVLGGFGGGEIDYIYDSRKSITPLANMRILHLFAYASGQRFERITPEYIRTSESMLANLVRSVLTPDEYSPIWDVEGWLEQRGKHYKPMFDYLAGHDVRRILEVGTYDGENAIGMIKTSRVLESQIEYYGFDLFKPNTEEQIKTELSWGYHNPPDVAEVLLKLKKRTRAHSMLYSGDSNYTFQFMREHEGAYGVFSPMDLIYIDGGHSPETIRSDWWNAEKLMHDHTVVFFDDYFIDREDAGCAFLEKEINKDKYDVAVVGEIDDYTGEFGPMKTRLMVVARKEAGLPEQLITKEAVMFDKKHMRFHLLGLAHIPTNPEIVACAYTQKVVKLARMLKKLGHEVIFYGVEGSKVECDEFVPVSTQAVLQECYGDYDWKVDQFKHDPKDHAHQVFNHNAIEEINKRKQPRDFLLVSMGNYQQPIADAVKIDLTVEMGIGYYGIFAKYKVFESYAWMHHVYGTIKKGDGDFYDCVIPNYFDPADFEFSDKKKDYFLYIGRRIHRKGIVIAKETCERIGAKLLVAGQTEGEGVDLQSPNVEIVGYADKEKRKELMRDAKAVFVPTIYIGPFEGVHIEAAFSGTPVITTDHGVFAETVLDHYTGFRCRTLDDFVWAAENIDKIKPQDCRDWAMKNFTLDRVANMYQHYFEQLQGLFGRGWYEITNNEDEGYRQWLQKWYPRQVWSSCRQKI
jgi:glycosyltransferase involved in cell wall biosynthesis